MTDEQLTELGRAVHEQLQRAQGDWPRVLVFELFDHKRRMAISPLHDRLKWSDNYEPDNPVSTIKFPDFYQA